MTLQEQAVCRTCSQPIWNEGGTIGGVRHAEGWSDRIEPGRGDSLVCFSARSYRHAPVRDETDDRTMRFMNS